MFKKEKTQQVVLSATDLASNQSLSSDYFVLTSDGFKNIGEITVNDKIAVRIKDEFIEYKNPKKVISTPYSGKMYNVETRGLSILCTPNHLLYIFRGRVRGKNTPWELVPAKDIKNKNFIGFAKTGIWQKKDYQVYLPEVNIYRGPRFLKKEPPVEVSMRPFLKFTGFFIAEGWVSPYNTQRADAGRIEISQSKLKERLWFENVLIDLNLAAVQYFAEGSYKDPSRGRYLEEKYRIYDKQYFQFFNELNKGARSSQKRLPDWTWELSQTQCLCLLEGLMFGDGDVELCYYTASPGLAYDVCRLVLHCGYGFSVRIKEINPNQEFPPSQNPYVQSIVRSNYPEYVVRTLAKTKNEPVINNQNTQDKNSYDDNYIDYSGMVYDIILDDRVMYVCRNGRGFWTGCCGESLN